VSDPRGIGVLRAAAQAYGWESRLAGGKKAEANGKPAQGRGVAWVNRDDVCVATIVDVTIDPSSGGRSRWAASWWRMIAGWW